MNTVETTFWIEAGRLVVVRWEDGRFGAELNGVPVDVTTLGPAIVARVETETAWSLAPLDPVLFSGG